MDLHQSIYMLNGSTTAESALQTILKRPEPEASATTSKSQLQPLELDVNQTGRSEFSVAEEENPVSISPQRNITAAQLFELQQALIEFITQSQSSRIYLAAQISTWKNFYTLYEQFGALEDYYGSEELRDEFINHVLPFIYNYTLTTEQESCLRLLNLHPHYKRTPEGFTLLSTDERPLNCREPKVNKDFRFVSAANTKDMFTSKSLINDKFQLDSNAAILAEDHHTLVVPENAMKFETEVSALTSAFLSAILSTDHELAANIVLEVKELKARLNAAKRNFEQNARMMENVKDHKCLLEKVRRIVKMRYAVEDILVSKYCL